MNTTDTTPRVYVACLASYNAGHLYGRWIDATDADEIRQEIAAMLAKSPIPGAEEYAIHDHDNFHGLQPGEYEDPENVAELGKAIDAHGPAFAAYAENVGADYATLEGFEEAFAGEWESEEAFAQELADQIGFEESDTWPGSCIDWERATSDLFMGDYWSAHSPDGVYVFRAV